MELGNKSKEEMGGLSVGKEVKENTLLLTTLLLAKLEKCYISYQFLFIFKMASAFSICCDTIKD